MIGCPNCGNKLVFDVESQKMNCRYCGTYYLISEASKWSKDAFEQTEDQEGMEVTTFTCSQCGAEISADSDEAVTWCSYCGSPATLTSRLTRMRRPDVVVPFRRSHDECVALYRHEARKQIYAPRAMIDHGTADGFRGIYMPYWTYDISRKGPYDFIGEVIESNSNEYNVSVQYRMTGELNSNYNGLSHDASQTFDDFVSERIAPYYFSNQKPFNICYLNGFYANAADQDDKVYRASILKTEAELIYTDAYAKFSGYGPKETSVLSSLAVQGYGAGFNSFSWREVDEIDLKKPAEDDPDKDLNVWDSEDETRRDVAVKSKLAMFPVWFMSYRWGDRVSYATMNGDTGKMYSEFPASPKRFLGISLLTAIPLFFLIYFLYTLTPEYVLFLALMSVIGASAMFRSEVVDIFRRQYHINMQAGTKPMKPKRKMFLVLCLIALLMLIPVIELWVATYIGIRIRYIYIIVAVIAALLLIVRFINMRSTYGGIVDVRMDEVNILFAALAFACAVIFIWNPASDTVYYTLACGSVAVVCLSVSELIRSYNILSSVRPKQFNRSGGEEDNA